MNCLNKHTKVNFSKFIIVNMSISFIYSFMLQVIETNKINFILDLN